MANHTKWSIRNKGMGGFLNPPGHAEHDYSVIEGRASNPRTMMSLSAAIKESYVPDEIKAAAKRLLAKHPGDVKNEEWIRSVYSYFRHCYSPDGKDRIASNCLVLNEIPSFKDRSLAYLHIRQFDPTHVIRTDLL